jgi:methylamine dehydrogenase accessory protein MauD
VLASDGPAEEHRAFIKRDGLDDLPYVISAPLGMAYRIGKLPYAVLIADSGRVIAHGLVNNREHLESLFEARRLGLPDVQSAARVAAVGA